MSAIQQLDNALKERIERTNAFVKTIIDIINQSVKMLPLCTPSNSTPEVAGSVKVLRKNLDDIIAKIRDNSNIDEAAAAKLVSRLELSNVKKNPDRSPRSSNSSAYGTPRSSETGSPTYTPASTSPELTLDRQLNPITTGEVRRPSEFNFVEGGKKTKRR